MAVDVLFIICIRRHDRLVLKTGSSKQAMICRLADNSMYYKSHSDSPPRRLSIRSEPTSHVSGSLITRNICVLTIKISTNIPAVNVRYS